MGFPCKIALPMLVLPPVSVSDACTLWI